MERVAVAANNCWFKSGDATFAAYKLAPELNSFSGRPRILVVHKGSPESRPLLVVQAEGSPSKLDAFGPMMDSPARAAHRPGRHPLGRRQQELQLAGARIPSHQSQKNDLATSLPASDRLTPMSSSSASVRSRSTRRRERFWCQSIRASKTARTRGLRSPKDTSIEWQSSRLSLSW
jgi:hypothetical protein